MLTSGTRLYFRPLYVEGRVPAQPRPQMGLVRGCIPNCPRHRPREHPSPVLIPKLGSRGCRSHLARALKWIRILLGVLLCVVVCSVCGVGFFCVLFLSFFFPSFSLLVFCNYKTLPKINSGAESRLTKSSVPKLLRDIQTGTELCPHNYLL